MSPPTTEEAASAHPPHPAASTDGLHIIPVAAQAEINSRVQQLLATGVNTPAISLAVDPANNGTLALPPVGSAKRPIPLFSSPLLVLDHLRANRIAASVASFPTAQLPSFAENWRKMGIDSFVFNLCPRCPQLNVLTPGTEFITTDQVRVAWVTYRVLRQWRGQKSLQIFLSKKSDVAAQRSTLEFVRDHVDYANPYVHWLIALFAGMQGDEPARLASTAKLEEFGPAFRDKTTAVTDQAKMPAWQDSMAKALFGFTHSFDVLAPAAPPSDALPN